MCERLLAAVTQCDLLQVEQVLGSNQTKGEQCLDRLQRTPLAIAAEKGSFTILEKLHDFGYDLEQRDKFGLTPLAYAAWKGHARIVSYLLDNGVDPMPFDHFGISPVHKAASFGHTEVLNELIRPAVASQGGLSQRYQTVPVNILTQEPTAPPEYEAKTLIQVRDPRTYIA
jgi:ankyrin repeat protein